MYFTQDDREGNLNAIIKASENITELTGIIIVGSGAYNFKDKYSDIDIVFVTGNNNNFENVSHKIKHKITSLFNIDFYNYSRRGNLIDLHNFYLDNYLEINACVLPLEKLSANKPYYKIIYDKGKKLKHIMDSSWEEYQKNDNLEKCFSESISDFWHYVNHAYVAMMRNQIWTCYSDIESIRTKIFNLLCYLNNLEPKRYREVDKLDQNILEKMSLSLCQSLNKDSLKSSIKILINLFYDVCGEINIKYKKNLDLKNQKDKLLALINGLPNNALE